MTGADPSEPRPADARPTRVRFLVLGSACALAVITYLQRVGFATAAAEFKGPLGLNEADLGLVMAAFMIAYGAFEIPWGLVGDRRGVRLPLGVVVVGGSIATAGVGVAALLPPGSRVVLIALIALRLAFGAFQAGTFPSISRMMADWMPSTERGAAQGLVWMSSRMGGTLAPIVLVPLFAAIGRWPAPLVILAGVGLAWAALFVPWFRDRPEEMAGVNPAERAIILGGRSKRIPNDGRPPWTSMLRSRSVWGLCIAYAAMGYSGNFFLTLLPSYLRTHRGFDPETAKWLSATPFALGVAACVLGGLASDAILRRTGNRRWGRRIVGTAGLGLAATAIAMTLRAETPIGLGILLSLTFAGNDLAMAPAWAAAADIGERHTGTLAGTMNMASSFTGALGAIVTGRLLVAGDGTTPFVIFAAVYAVGTLAWLAVDASRPLADAPDA